jgi:hypothetical protein
VEVGIVMCFAGFEKAVTRNLPLAIALRVGEKAMVVVGKCAHLEKAGFLLRNGFEFQ